jgi:hypothetical protein
LNAIHTAIMGTLSYFRCNELLTVRRRYGIQPLYTE